MGLLDFFQKKSVQPPTTQDVQVVDIKNLLEVGWSSTDGGGKFTKYITNENFANGVLYAVVSNLSMGIAEVWVQGVEITDNNHKELDNKETKKIFALMDEPNDEESGEEFITLIAYNLLLCGECFIYAPYIEMKGIEEMEIWNTSEVSVSTNSELKVQSYTYRGKTYEKEVVLHLRLPNPDKLSYRGLSPMVSILKDLDTSTSIKNREKKLVDEGGVKNIISVKDLPDGNVETIIDRLRQSLNGDKAKRNEIKALPMSAIRLGDTVADLGLLEMGREKDLMICKAYNYPPNLLTADSTFSNLAEAKKQIYTLAIPYLRIILSGLMRQLRMRRQGMKFYINKDKIEELKPNRLEMVNAVDGFTTTNEKRELFDYPKVKGGDDILTKVGQATLEDVVSPQNMTD